MVSDAPRTQAYAAAIRKNKHLFEGKVAMDVGAGTGESRLLYVKLHFENFSIIILNNGGRIYITYMERTHTKENFPECLF